MQDYKYQILSQSEQDDIIVSYFLGQERDKFCHEINKERYELMLKTAGEGDWKDQIKGLLSQEVIRIKQVDSLISATQSQLPSKERIKASIARIELANEKAKK